MYARYLDGSQAPLPGQGWRPRPRLIEFRRVHLEAGQTTLVSLEFRPQELARWSDRRRRLVVDEGEVEILVGRSASDIELRATVRITAPLDDSGSADG